MRERVTMEVSYIIYEIRYDSSNWRNNDETYASSLSGERIRREMLSSCISRMVERLMAETTAVT